jgi:peptidoglycan/xylan/chitin deacetylase (PgdA/CDA1 family)
LASSASVEIGSHSITHTRLSSLSPQQQQYEIAESKQQLESIIQKPIRLFSYPYGGLEDITKETGRILAGAGYDAGIANVQGSLVSPIDMYEVPRRLVRNWSGPTFAQWLRNDGKVSLEAQTLSDRAQRIIDSSFLPWSKQKQTIQPQNKVDFKDCFPVAQTEVFL